MGLFNAHAVAQQRADRIATLLQSWGAPPHPPPPPPAPPPPPPP
ncbi:energy transducer TonB, partial [Pseudomonas aeruginosa]|nr:energy transducer TonB [Pseudomonas aeruginosa]